jgi:hypothetical protein
MWLRGYDSPRSCCVLPSGRSIGSHETTRLGFGFGPYPPSGVELFYEVSIAERLIAEPRSREVVSAQERFDVVK